MSESVFWFPNLKVMTTETKDIQEDLLYLEGVMHHEALTLQS